MSLYFIHKTSLKNFVKNIKTHIRFKFRYFSELRSIGPKLNSKRVNVPLKPHWTFKNGTFP